MTETQWLIAATIAGPILGAVFAPGFTRAVLALARVRAQRVKHIPATGTELFALGVPLTETQFRGAFAAMQAELDELPPPAERDEWQLRRQYAAINRLSFLAGTYPHAFPIRNNADDAWTWYSANNAYVAGAERMSRATSADWLADPAPLLQQS